MMNVLTIVILHIIMILLSKMQDALKYHVQGMVHTSKICNIVV